LVHNTKASSTVGNKLKNITIGHIDIYPQWSIIYHAVNIPPKKCNTEWITDNDDTNPVPPENKPKKSIPKHIIDIANAANKLFSALV